MKKHSALLLLVLLMSMSAISGGQVARATAPAGFTETQLTSLSGITALAFTPDGRLLLTRQSGQIRIYTGGALLATPAIDLDPQLCDNFERGVLGIAVDPAFASNHYVYVYYTFNKHGNCAYNQPTSPVNRVSRFTLGDNNLISGASELVLVDNIPSQNGNHNAGDLHFGADGLLYISTGDSGTGGALARVVDNLAGKMLRINKDGTIPAANPYASAGGSRRCGDPPGVPGGTGPCREIIAHGLRNPFRFAMRPGTSQFYINDVGQGTWEEVDQGIIGADYGWNVREGFCARGSTSNCGAPPAGMTNPLLAYGRDDADGDGDDDNCNVITGGAFVPSGIWPAPYDGAYLFGDAGCGRIWRMVDEGGGSYGQEEFITNAGGMTAMTFGPHGAGQALYFVSTSGWLRRVVYSGGNNRAPVAVATASPGYGAAPLIVALSASGSYDPDGDPISYRWNFGDGDPIFNTANVSTNHTYDTPGIYTATLTVLDNRAGISQVATVQIQAGNTPPVPTISSPSIGYTFAVSEQLMLQGSASDAQDGTLPGSRLFWEVRLHHVDEINPQTAHTHPLLPATPGLSASLQAPQPEDRHASALSYVELRLTATDSWGLSRTITRTLEPSRVELTFETSPAGLSVQVWGSTLDDGESVVSWENYPLRVAAPPLFVDGESWALLSWSDGLPWSHTIQTPASSGSYTATFAPGHTLWLPMARR